VDHLFGYTGRAYDEETGLQNNLNRWYDAASGKWLSEDPIGFAAGDANLYRYVGNSPTLATDPNGLYELEFDGGNWTQAQKDRVKASLKRARKRVGELLKELDTAVKKLNDCERRHMATEIETLKSMLNNIKNGIDSKSENLEFTHFDFDDENKVETDAHGYDAGYYGILGLYQDAQIDFNDGANGKTWETMPTDRFDEIMLHELTRVYESDDGESGIEFWDGNNYDYLMHGSIENSAAWKDALKEAGKKAAAEKSRRCNRRIWIPPTIFGPYPDEFPYGPDTA
jgi:RHS repeat-associated protein